MFIWNMWLSCSFLDVVFQQNTNWSYLINWVNWKFQGDGSLQTTNPEDKSKEQSLECENKKNSLSDKIDSLEEKSEEIQDATSIDNKEDNVKADIAKGDKVDELGEDFSELNVNDILSPVSDEEYESEDYDEEDDDDSDWITPENVKQVKRQMDFGLTEDKKITVGCVTTDFAMQVSSFKCK